MRFGWMLLLSILIGCESNQAKKDETVLTIDQVPVAALNAAKQKFPDVKFDTVWKMGEDSYEIRGKNAAGKIHEVEVDKDGKILAIE